MQNRQTSSRIVKIIQYAIAGIIIISAVVLLSPFYPEVEFQLGIVSLKTQRLEDREGIPEINTIVIPKIGVDMPVVEGETEEALEQGAWRVPETSTPDQGGNTVISAHRWKLLPPSTETFYNLDKLEIGDEVTVYWERKKYNYLVNDIFEVDKTAVEIQDNTEDSRLTLFTCTPLFSTDLRLVVVSELIE